MEVGYRLRREIRDWFPAGTTPAERLVALEIADDARDETRISLMPQEKLCSRAGISADGLRKVFQRLHNSGLEFRRVRGIGRDGRPVFTKPGCDLEFQVPPADAFRKARGLPDDYFSGGTGVPPSGAAGPVDKPP